MPEAIKSRPTELYPSNSSHCVLILNILYSFSFADMFFFACDAGFSLFSLSLEDETNVL